MTKKNVRFLLIQTAFIGDTILATALLEKLHTYHPHAEIDLLVRKGNESLFTGHPFLRKIHCWNKHSKNKYLSLIPIITELRKQHFDICFNLQRHATTGIVTLLSGAKTTVGFTMNPCSRLFTRRFLHKIDQASGRTHETDLYVQLLSGIVPSSARSKPKVYPGPDDFEQCRNYTSYVTIAPTSVWYTKQLPAERWLAVINHLPVSGTILLLGGASDHEACEHLSRSAARTGIVNLAGSLTLLQSAALMKGAIMNFANDSAPVHLAGAVDAPITAIFCSTTPSFGYTPLSTRSRIVQSDSILACKPCGPHGHARCPEGHFRCSHISPKSILGELYQS